MDGVQGGNGRISKKIDKCVQLTNSRINKLIKSPILYYYIYISRSVFFGVGAVLNFSRNEAERRSTTSTRAGTPFHHLIQIARRNAVPGEFHLVPPRPLLSTELCNIQGLICGGTEGNSVPLPILRGELSSPTFLADKGERRVPHSSTTFWKEKSNWQFLAKSVKTIRKQIGIFYLLSGSTGQAWVIIW